MWEWKSILDKVAVGVVTAFADQLRVGQDKM
jgi:hypothetical protein